MDKAVNDVERKTKSIVDMFIARERIEYQEVYKIQDWLFNPRTCEFENVATKESGRGFFKFIKRLRGLK